MELLFCSKRLDSGSQNDWPLVRASALRNMSIYSLGSDAWQRIAGYLDALDLLELLSTGDSTLCAALKPSIRDFALCLRTTNAPRLSSLLSLFKRSSSHLSGLSISLAEYYDQLKFVPEEHETEKWQSLVPETLEALQLALDCSSPPFSSLLTSLATVAPKLTALYITKAPKELTLPSSLTKLELGLLPAFVMPPAAPNHANLLQSLPTTLTHLKIIPNSSLTSEIAASDLPFQKMPLVVFHASITFRSLSKEEARWSILPNTIVDLKASFIYGMRNQFFDPPTDLSWKQLFPGLVSLEVPLGSLAEISLLQKPDASQGEEILAEQIEKIASSFPESLTALQTIMMPIMLGTRNTADVTTVLRAIGSRLRVFQQKAGLLDKSVLQWMPHWEDPRVQLFGVTIDPYTQTEMFAAGENFEIFSKNENHAISQLSRNATSLSPGPFPASALSLLPRTIASLEVRLMQKESFSLESASEASKRNDARNNVGAGDSNNLEFNSQLGWTQLGWPTALTSLQIVMAPQGVPLHLGCLPATLTALIIDSSGPFNYQGGNLAHMKRLTFLSVYSAPDKWITSLNDLPRSLRSITIEQASEAFEKAELRNFFFHLEKLVLNDQKYSPDVLQWVPPTLTSLALRTVSDKATWNERQFENLAKTKLAFLQLAGDAQWPFTLTLNVFSRFLPKTLATLALNIADWNKKGFLNEDIAMHIPSTLLSFQSTNYKLEGMVKEKLSRNTE